MPIFVLVTTVVLYSVINFRMRPGEEQEDGPPLHGNTRLEVVWTAVPTVLIVVAVRLRLRHLRPNEKSQGRRDHGQRHRAPVRLRVLLPAARRQVISSPVLYLAKGQPYVFKLRSLDVIHSFFVPEFSEKLDAVPGITTTLRVTPTRLGSYPAECTELCGAGHALMRAPVRVVTPQAFQTWLASQKPAAPPPIGHAPGQRRLAGEPGPGLGADRSSARASASSTRDARPLGHASVPAIATPSKENG